jgi:RNA polymerase sigma factor (sigma-70 family)
MDSGKTDFELLETFARTADHEVFAQIVSRYADLVYSAALRQVGPRLAEDVSQAVFLIRSRKAPHINGHFLAGWLVNAARLAGMASHRMELRRTQRERSAAIMKNQLIGEHRAHAQWDEISPLLDQAMARLGEKDRCAVTLRYLQGKSVREVAAAMSVSEDAAAKRSLRAITKLRDYFARHGVASLSSESLTGVLAVHAVVAAPLGLAAKVTATAAAGAAATSLSGAATIAKGTLTLMLTAQAKAAAAVAVVAIVVAGGSSVLIVNHLHHSGPRSVTIPSALPREVGMQVVQALPDVAAPSLQLPTATLPLATEIFTRYPTPPGEKARFVGRVEGLTTTSGAEIGIVYLRGTHWLTANNYQWQPLAPDGTFNITADKFPAARRAVMVRSKTQSATVLRAQFESKESAKDIILRAKPVRPITLTLKNSRDVPVETAMIEIFVNQSDDQKRPLSTQRLDNPTVRGGRITLPMPLQPISLFISGGGIAPYYYNIDPRTSDRFEFKLLAPARITGTVTNGGKPVPNVRVILTNGAVGLSTVYRKTDAAGRFQWSAGIPGTYEISVGKKHISRKVSEGANEPINIEMTDPDEGEAARDLGAEALSDVTATLIARAPATQPSP